MVDAFLHSLNPLSLNSDQHQSSPNNIHILAREMVIRIYKMITKGKNALICYQTLSTNSLRKSMKISMENVYVDIET